MKRLKILIVSLMVLFFDIICFAQPESEYEKVKNMIEEVVAEKFEHIANFIKNENDKDEGLIIYLKKQSQLREEGNKKLQSKLEILRERNAVYTNPKRDLLKARIKKIEGKKLTKKEREDYEKEIKILRDEIVKESREYEEIVFLINENKDQEGRSREELNSLKNINEEKIIILEARKAKRLKLLDKINRLNDPVYKLSIMKSAMLPIDDSNILKTSKKISNEYYKILDKKRGEVEFKMVKIPINNKVRTGEEIDAIIDAFKAAKANKY